MKHIIIAGGSGFIGQALTAALIARGYDVSVLSRGKEHVQWDGHSLGEWAHRIDGAEAVVNLTGKSVNCRHTPENRREIIRSRVDSVRVLGEAIAASRNPPRVFVQASGVGYYGDTGAFAADESGPVGSDFMAEVCRQWEGALEPIEVRKVILRIGVVLGRNGGALPMLEKLTRLFLGGAVGSGRQFMSWIQIADVVRMFIAAIERDDLAGAFNATAPTPVTNTEFMRELRRALHRPWSPPIPQPLVRLGAWLMGTEGELAMLCSRCIPRRFLEHGFIFDFPTLREAFDLYRKERP